MSKHYVEAYSWSGKHEDWRTWYSRAYNDGLKSCVTRMYNLSKKYPNTLRNLMRALQRGI